MKMRLETVEGFRNGSELPTFLTVEWAGRIGHPSSYGLLGGARSDSPMVNVGPAGGSFKRALTGRADDVRWGLPKEYAAAILASLADAAQPVSVSKAAHGMVGSSERAFVAVALLLSQLLALGMPVDDVDVWTLWDRCWNATG